MKRTLTLGLMAVFAVGAVFAQADDFEALAGEASVEAPASVGALEWTGDQEFAWRWGVAENPTRKGGNVDATLGAAYELGAFKLVGAATVRNGEFVPGETVLSWAPGAFKFTAGLQEFSWGLADARNPTDTLNARDYRFGADAPRLTNPAATVAWYPADWLSVEAVYEPWKDQSLFPKDFRANTQANLSALGTTVTARVRKADGSEPVFGGRANFFLPGVDLSLSYVYDWDTYYTPVITSFQAGSQLPGVIDLQLKRVQRLGLNAKTTVDRFGFWLETAYNVTEDVQGTDVAVRNSKLSWTSGSDFSYGPAGEYYVNVQYAGEWIPGYDAATVKDYAADPVTNHLGNQAYMKQRFYRSLVQSLGSESEEWMHTVTASLKWPLADATVTPSLSGAVLVPVGYDATSQTRLASTFFKPELDLVPADGVHVVVGADLAYGWVKKAGSSEVSLDTETDKLGVYTPQNSVYVKVHYRWNGSLGRP